MNDICTSNKKSVYTQTKDHLRLISNLPINGVINLFIFLIIQFPFKFVSKEKKEKFTFPQFYQYSGNCYLLVLFLASNTFTGTRISLLLENFLFFYFMNKIMFVKHLTTVIYFALTVTNIYIYIYIKDNVKIMFVDNHRKFITLCFLCILNLSYGCLACLDSYLFSLFKLVYLYVC